MKNALAKDPSRECYVVEIDGMPRFEYRVLHKSTLGGTATEA